MVAERFVATSVYFPPVRFQETENFFLPGFVEVGSWESFFKGSSAKLFLHHMLFNKFGCISTHNNLFIKVRKNQIFHSECDSMVLREVKKSGERAVKPTLTLVSSWRNLKALSTPTGERALSVLTVSSGTKLLVLAFIHIWNNTRGAANKIFISLYMAEPDCMS